MTIKYKCTNNGCDENKDHGHRLALPAELVMDEKNVAMMFCPKCKRKLKQIK